MNTVHQIAHVDLNLLVVLDELLRVRSTTLAARRLGRTQSAVSHALGRLRAMFKDPLFVRAGATLRPTSRAEEMQGALRDVLAHTEAIVTRSGASFDPSRLERTFVVAGTDYAEIVLMPRLMPLLRREAPGVAVVTRFVGDDLERVIQSREVDLGYGTRFRNVAGLVEEPIGHEEMRAILRRNHPALKKRLTAKDYAALDHVLVTPRGLPGGSVDDALAPLGLTRRVVLRMPHFAAAALIVAQTDLVVTLPAGFAVHMAKRLGLVAVPLPFVMPGFTFAIAYSASYADDAGHRWFRARVVASAQGR